MFVCMFKVPVKVLFEGFDQICKVLKPVSDANNRVHSPVELLHFSSPLVGLVNEEQKLVGKQPPGLVEVLRVGGS